MIVTDAPMNRALIEAILRAEPEFEVLMSADPADMARAFLGVDLIILDLAITGDDLFPICKDIKSHGNASSVPLLLITPQAGATSMDRSRALDAGADDVVAKPFHRSELLLRVKSLLRIKMLHDELEEVETILYAMSRMIEGKLSYAQAHGERVARYCEMIGIKMGLGRDELRLLKRAAMIHDIGKAAVPDLLLNRPSSLSGDELRQIRSQSLFPQQQVHNGLVTPQLIPVIRHHTEHFDGTGYPDGLAGEQIPIGARILAVADAFDTMTSQRPYRSALTEVRAKAQLLGGAGHQWDGGIVEVFIGLLDSKSLDATDTEMDWAEIRVA